MNYLLFKYLVGLVVLTILSLAGYFVFLGFITQNQVLLSVFPLAIVAGVASFFSPCVFPLLPTVVATTLKAERKINPLLLGLTGALGVASFLLILGLIIAAVGQPLGVALQQNLGIIRGVVGVFLIYLAVNQLSDKFHFNLLEKLSPQVAITKKAPIKSVYLYGFGYTLAGSGCTVPILGGLTLGALVSGGFMAAFASFSLAAIVMAALMFIFMIFAGSIKTIPENLTAATPKIKKVAGVVLLIIGMFYILNAFFKFV